MRLRWRRHPLLNLLVHQWIANFGKAKISLLYGTARRLDYERPDESRKHHTFYKGILTLYLKKFRWVNICCDWIK